jgi:hypothetical protein
MGVLSPLCLIGLWVCLLIATQGIDTSDISKWSVVHSEGIGYKETPLAAEHAATSIAISANQAYAVSCGPGSGNDEGKNDAMPASAPWLRFWRTTMYPNLYPEWPLLLYGSLRSQPEEQLLDSSEENIVKEEVKVCQMSEDGGTVLWASSMKKKSSKTERHDNDPGRQRLRIRMASRIRHDDHEQKERAQYFETIHPRDGHGQIWVESNITFATSASAAVLSRDGKWLAAWDGTFLTIEPTTQGDMRSSKLQFQGMDQVTDSELESQVLALFSPDSQCVLLVPHVHNAACINSDGTWEATSTILTNDRVVTVAKRCISTASAAGLDGGLESTMWGSTYWNGDCDDETLWGRPSACHASQTAPISRFLLILAGCGGTDAKTVDVMMVTQTVKNEHVRLSVQLMQTLRYNSGKSMNTEPVLGVASSGRVIAVAQKGGNVVHIWRWFPNTYTILSQTNVSRDTSLDAKDGGSIPDYAWGVWVEEDTLSIRAGYVTGIAVLALRRTYLLVTTGAGLFVAMDAKDVRVAAALARQVCVCVTYIHICVCMCTCPRIYVYRICTQGVVS